MKSLICIISKEFLADLMRQTAFLSLFKEMNYYKFSKLINDLSRKKQVAAKFSTSTICH